MRKVLSIIIAAGVCFFLFTLGGCNLFIGIFDTFNDPDNGDGGDGGGIDIPGDVDPLPPDVNGIEVIDSGFSKSTDLVHYGISSYNNCIFLTSWHHNMITKIESPTHTIAPGYPAYLEDVTHPHGLAVDPSDGSVWVCDLNNGVVRHYDENNTLLDSKPVGVQPVNLLIIGDMIYVADREEDAIYILDKSTLSIETYFPIPNADPEYICDYIDLFHYAGSIFIVAEDMDGIEIMTNTGSHEGSITLTGYPQVCANGIYVINETIYLNTGNRIVKADMAGNELTSFDIDRPDGYAGDYIDVEILGDTMYIPSWNGCGGRIGAHILAYPLTATD